MDGKLMQSIMHASVQGQQEIKIDIFDRIM